MKNHYLSFLLLLLVEGVFSDVMMSVMEGDSVTLQIDVTEIQGAETLMWTFNNQSDFIAKIDRENKKIIPVPPKNVERFRNRLQVDQIGSLTITNIRTEDSALYTLEIRNSHGSSSKRFRVTVYRVSDVETKTVIKGDSVILQTDLTGLQTGDVFQWSYFTPEETPIARVTIGAGDSYTRVFDDADVRFRGRLYLNSETGSLIISDIRNELSGLYKLEIIGSQTKSKIFRVTVIDLGLSTGAIAIIAVVVIVALLLLIAAAAAAGVIHHRRKVSELRNQIGNQKGKK
ncbi:uncharacterized protein LOC127639804 isoform X3 [Xyrauchen texanus]|uniref:uncharacterized protein LOC127639804 isoform X3 n=1 Tax=Xyrauchen texanus TaxID=154827 RepID=UPI0022418AEE|nr:uncharacterized protein LOC127639804 isoform X3 [Xyrauchen texanus]